MTELRNRLSFRLILSTMALLLFLIAAVVIATNLGLEMMQQGAMDRSAEGLKDQGRMALLQLTSREAQNSNKLLKQAADLTRIAARYMEAMHRSGGSFSWDSNTEGVVTDISQLTRLSNGLLYDANPSRKSETTFSYHGMPDEETAEDLKASAVLDTLFQTLLERAEDSIAIYFQSPQQLMRYYPVIGLPFILNTDQPVVKSTLPLNDMRVAPVNNPERRTVWDPPYVDNVGQGLMITTYSPVYFDDEYHGFIAMDISLTRLIAHLQSIRPDSTMEESDGFSFLLDQDGRLVAAPAKSLSVLFNEEINPEDVSLASTLGRQLTESKNPDLQKVVSAMQTGQSGVEEIQLAGKQVLLAYAPLPDLKWSFGLVAPVEEVTAQARAVAKEIGQDSERTLQYTLLIIAFFSLLALIGVFLASKNLTRPISALVAGTQAVAAGDLNVTLPVVSRDELGMLADAFNKMTSELKKRNLELANANQSLRERERQYRSIFESTTDGLFIFDASGNLVDFNPSACLMVGYLPEELRQTDTKAFIHPQSMPVFDDFIKTVSTGRQFRGRADLLFKDGTPFPVEVNAAPFTYRNSPHVLGVFRDVTEQVQAYQLLEQRVQERTRELSTLLTVSRTLASTLDLKPLLDLILDQLKEVVDYSGALLFILEGKSDLILLSERRSGTTSLYSPSQWEIQQASFLNEVIQKKTPLIISDVNADNLFADAWRNSNFNPVDDSQADVCSWMSIPLVSKEKVIGILNLEHCQVGYYNTLHSDLAMAFGTQAAVAIENARLYSQAQNLAVLEERQRLARELHDSVSQALYGIALGTRTARTLLDRDSGISKDGESALKEPLDYVLSLADAGLAEMRALIFELRPESLEMEGLVAALTKQAAAIQARHDLQVDAHLCEEPDIPLVAKEAFYRIAQEALNNVVKHARATEVKLCLSNEDGDLSLEIEDNGVGFDAEVAYPGHLGLKSMPERVERLGGSFQIQSGVGKGTRIFVKLPAVAKE